MSKRAPDRAYQGGDNKRRSHGKPMIKLLCPYYCAGAIIGKGGETIKELMDKTNCDVKISKTDERFPTTSERVVSIQGETACLEECVLFCQDKIRKDEPPPNAKRESHAVNAKRKECCKLIVSDTSAGRIIGKGGQRIKDLKNDYNVVINISRKDEMPRGFEERCVSIEGEAGNVDSCTKEIVKLVCEDDTANMEWHVFYNDWNDRGRSDRFDDRGFGSRDTGRDDYGGRDGGYGGRDGGYGGRDGGYGGRDDNFRDGGRDNYSRDYGRDGGFNDRERGRDSRDYGRDGGRDNYSSRDSYSRDDGYTDRDNYTRDAPRDSYGSSGRDDFRGTRDSNFGRNDSFGGRDSGRDSGYGRDNRDSGRNSFGSGGGSYNDRRDDFRGGNRDGPRGGRY